MFLFFSIDLHFSLFMIFNVISSVTDYNESKFSYEIYTFIFPGFTQVTLKSMQSTDHRKVNLDLASFSSCHRFWLIFFF